MGTIATEFMEMKRDERGRRITRAAERGKLVKEYEASGQTQKAFAKQEGMKYTTFVSWVQEQRRPKMGFVELTLPRAAATPLEVQLADGTISRGSKVEEVVGLLQLFRCERFPRRCGFT